MVMFKFQPLSSPCAKFHAHLTLPALDAAEAPCASCLFVSLAGYTEDAFGLLVLLLVREKEPVVPPLSSSLRTSRSVASAAPAQSLADFCKDSSFSAAHGSTCPVPTITLDLKKSLKILQVLCYS
ncbi:uncharacterized protein [Zea mays]|uniref:uncharacterized protein n=1 Tax=Zea mays TaxID=4577 RepID=UPI0009A94E3F|nr:uncharacterized protein LOC109945631 [Zea mays]|eukprot:XP_020407534.1 uncharacterized protein LOC109945631 [Zea mays]